MSVQMSVHVVSRLNPPTSLILPRAPSAVQVQQKVLPTPSNQRQAVKERRPCKSYAGCCMVPPASTETLPAESSA